VYVWLYYGGVHWLLGSLESELEWVPNQ